MAHEKCQWLVVLKTVNNLPVPPKVGNSLTYRVSIILNHSYWYTNTSHAPTTPSDWASYPSITESSLNTAVKTSNHDYHLLKKVSVQRNQLRQELKRKKRKNT